MSTSVNKNTVFNTVKTIFGIIYPLITFPYVSRILMVENVGKVNFGNSIVSYFALIASLGVTAYAIRECSKVKESRENLGKLSSQIISINIFSTLIAYILLGGVLLFAESLGNYRFLICIQATVILFTTLGADWLNTAMEDFKFIAVRTIGMQIISLILMFIFVREPDDYIKYAAICVIASSGANIINIFYRRKFCKAYFTLHMDLRRHLPPIILMFSMMISQIVYCNSSITILGLLRGDFEVGLYSTSIKMYTLVNTVIASIAWVVMPQLSANFAKNNFTEINRLLKYALNYILILGLPCVIGMYMLAKEIILTFAGAQYVDATLSLQILSFSLAFSFIGGWVGNMMLIPSGKEKICLISGIAAALVNAVFCVIFIPRYGLSAAAIATALSEFISLNIGYHFVDKRINIDNKRELLTGPFCGILEIILIVLCVKAVFASHFLVLFLSIAISTIVYSATLYLVKNKFFLGFIQPVLNKLKRS